MKIGELSQRTGMATSAIRFYESSGLLPAAERGSNGYRQYGDAALQRLQMIQLGQRLGFGLDQLRELFAACHDGLPHDLILKGLNDRLAQIDKLAADLERQRAETLALRDQLTEEWAAGRCVALEEAGKEKAA
ncbi:MerR family transcriptional regulator [Roseateles sp. NT4]|uniref:MerR family transcriptional regulator n=1 Tax=Roseateles sp. NT4 TaxID=3453715 RepID=UPI003EEAC26F